MDRREMLIESARSLPKALLFILAIPAGLGALLKLKEIEAPRARAACFPAAKEGQGSPEPDDE